MFTAPSLTLKMLQKRLKNGELDLSSLRLETVPIELICRCVNFGGEKHKKIKEINLGNNLLAELPQQFCAFFSELEVLNLGNNKIKALPEDFGSLSSLYHLDLSNNRIKVSKIFLEFLKKIFFKETPSKFWWFGYSKMA